MGRLEGKTALITAAAAGIGRASALAFAADGASVIATDIDEAALATLAGDRIAVRRLDVRDTEAVNALAAETGPVDILFNCAGYVHHGNALSTGDDDWDVSFDINVKGMHRTIRAFLPGMLEAGGGAIVNMASAVSSVKPAPNRYAYGSSKAAVIGLTKAVAADYIRDGIRANAICPGAIRSPSLEARMEALSEILDGSIDAAWQTFIDRHPVGRIGTPEEVAALALYLASDESAYTTGQTFVIDGGFAL